MGTFSNFLFINSSKIFGVRELRSNKAEPKWPCLRRHPFSVLREPISDAIVWGSSFRFSARALIRMMTRIMQIAFANGLPTARERQEFGIIL